MVEDIHCKTAADLFSAFSTVNRVKTFALLVDGKAPKQITEELGLSRPSLQPYIDDFKELGLIRIEGKEYVVTEKGVEIYEDILRSEHLM